MRRAAVLLAGLAVVAACGGGGGTPHATGATSGARDGRDEYVAAAEQGLMSGRGTFDRATARCMAVALVDDVGVGALRSAGITPASLRAPDKDIHALRGRLSSAEASKLAAAVQRCDVGRAVAGSLAGSLGVRGSAVDDASKRCVAQRIDAPGARGLVADLLLSHRGSSPPVGDARQLVDILVDCIDLGDAFASGADVKLTAAETSCVSERLRASDALKQAMAQAIASGSDASSSPAFDEGFASLAVGCVDFGKLVASQLDVPLSAAEESCINDTVRSDETLRRATAQAIAGGGGSGGSSLAEEIGKKIVSCLTPEHLQKLGPSGAGA